MSADRMSYAYNIVRMVDTFLHLGLFRIHITKHNVMYTSDVVLPDWVREIFRFSYWKISCLYNRVINGFHGEITIHSSFRGSRESGSICGEIAFS